jgi:hypothetical protein
MVASLAKARLHPWERCEVVSCKPAAAMGVEYNWGWAIGGRICGPDSYSKLYAAVSLEGVIREAWGTAARRIFCGVGVCLIVTHCRSFESCPCFKTDVVSN